MNQRDRDWAEHNRRAAQHAMDQERERRRRHQPDTLDSIAAGIFIFLLVLGVLAHHFGW